MRPRCRGADEEEQEVDVQISEANELKLELEKLKEIKKKYKEKMNAIAAKRKAAAVSVSDSKKKKRKKATEPREGDPPAEPHNDPSDSESVTGESVASGPSTSTFKIPRKNTDFTAMFHPTKNCRVDYVQGWQPNTISTVDIKLPKTYRDKILRNEFYSYRDLHKFLTKKESNFNAKLTEFLVKGANAQVDMDDQFDKNVRISLLEFVMLQTQFFAVYQQMYPDHILSHNEYMYELWEMIQRGVLLSSMS